MPAAPSGEPTAALGGSLLGINARSEHRAAAWAVIDYLTRPAQMIERAVQVGQYPPRRSLYRGGRALPGRLAIPLAAIRRVIERARSRPVTPVYSELSGLLQVRLHAALTGQRDPAPALSLAAREMRELLARKGLGSEAVGDAADVALGARRDSPGCCSLRPSGVSSPSRCFPSPGPSASRSISTIFARPGWASPGSDWPTTPRRSGTAVSGSPSPTRWDSRP